MLDRGWQQGVNKDGKQRGMRVPDSAELCDFERTRSKSERDSGTIHRVLKDLLETAPPYAAQVRGFLKRFAACNSTGKTHYLSMLHIRAYAFVTILPYEVKRDTSPVPSIKTPWTTRWVKAEIELGRKPELS